MFAAWKVAVVLSARNLTGAAFAGLMADAGKAEVATARLQRMLRTFTVGAAVGAIGIGAALEYGIGKGIQKASELQSALINLQTTTNMNDVQLNAAHSLALQITSQTSQSIQQILSEFTSAVRGGLTPSQLLGGDGSLFRKMAYFADILYRTPGVEMNPREAIYDTAKIAHMLGAYSPSAMQDVTERIYAAVRTGPFELDKMVTQGKYYMSLFHNLGASYGDIISMTSFMGQLGYMQGRGGTGMQALALGLINAAQMTSSRQKKQRNALKDLGLIDAHGHSLYMSAHQIGVDASGRPLYKNNFDMMGMMAHLVDYAKHHPAVGFAGLINSALGRIAVPLISAASMGKAYEQFKKIHAEQTALMAHMGIEKAQHKLIYERFSGATSVLSTNIQSLWAELFLPLTNALTPFVGEVANFVYTLTWFVHQHPAIAVRITLAAAAAGFALMLGGASALTIMAWRATAAMIALSRSIKTEAVASGRGGLLNLLGNVPGVKALKKTSGFKRLFGYEMEGFIPELGYSSKFVDAGLLRGTILPVLTQVFGALGRIALRFVPIVGGVLLFVSALSLLKGHATDIGYVLGSTVRWVTHSFGPMLVGAFKGAFVGSHSTLNRLFKGNVTQWFHDLYDAFEAGLSGQTLEHYRKKHKRYTGKDNLTLAMEGKGPWSSDALLWKPLGKWWQGLAQSVARYSQHIVTSTLNYWKQIWDENVKFWSKIVSYITSKVSQFEAWNMGIWNRIVNAIQSAVTLILGLFSTLGANLVNRIHAIPFIGDKLVPHAPTTTSSRVVHQGPVAVIHVNGARNPREVANEVADVLSRRAGLAQRSQAGQTSHPYSFDSLLGLGNAVQ